MIWVSVLISIPVVTAAFLYVGFLISSNHPERVFNQGEWNSKRYFRFEFTKVLLSENKLIGLSPLEVKKLLGKPDNEADSMLMYYVGYSPKIFMNMDPDWLELQIKGGKVVEAQVRP